MLDLRYKSTNPAKCWMVFNWICDRMQPLADEKELIERAQQGDKEAAGRLYEAYAKSIFQYIGYRVETDEIAEDLTAEVFLRMVRGLKKYTYTGAPLGAWLFRVASNQITDHYRQRSKMPTTQIPETYRSNIVDPLDEVLQHEERAHLRQALQTLSEDYQNVLILRFMQDLPHATVALVMERSEAAVRVLQHRALKALNTALTRQTNDDKQRKGGNNE